MQNLSSPFRGSGGKWTEPSAYDFASAYRIAYFNIFSSKSKYTNFEDDENKWIRRKWWKGLTAYGHWHSRSWWCFESASFEMLDFIARNTITVAGYISI